MAVGAPTTRQDIDAQTAAVVVTIRDSFDRASRINTWLAERSDSDLTGLGYSTADVQLLRDAFAQLNQLRLVANNSATVPTANDFLFHARKLAGLL